MLASCCSSNKGGKVEKNENAVKYPSVQHSRSRLDWMLIGFMYIVAVLLFAFCIIGSIVASQSDGNGAPSKATEVKVELPSKIATPDDLLVSGFIRQEYQPIPPAIEKMIAEYAAAGLRAEWRGTRKLTLVFDSPKYLDGKDGGRYVYKFLVNKHPEVINNEVNFYHVMEWKTVTVNLVRTSKPYDTVATKTIKIPNIREYLQNLIRTQFNLDKLKFPQEGVEEEDGKVFHFLFNEIELSPHFCGNCKLVHLDGTPRDTPRDRKMDAHGFVPTAHLKYNEETDTWAWKGLKLVPQADEAIFAL
eukprot:134701_1